MAFNVFDYLKQGKVDFVFELTNYDYNNIIKKIRGSDERAVITNGFYEALKDYRPRFCFSIMYDMEDRKDEFYYLISLGCYIGSFEMLYNLLKNTSWGVEYYINNLNTINKVIRMNNDELNKLYKLLLSNHQKFADVINCYVISKNLHYRALLINFIITNYPDKLLFYFPDLLNSLTSFTNQENEQFELFPELMESYDIASIAYNLFKNKDLRNHYFSLKDYIFSNYKYNDLAEVLLEKNNKNFGNLDICNQEDEDLMEFKKDANKLFETSRRYQFYIYNNYVDLVSKELINNWLKYLSFFEKKDHYLLSHLYRQDLGRKLTNYIDKYLSLSTSSLITPLKPGSTCHPYRIGDYVIKLFDFKWSYEDVICPNLYLIIKNLEEDYVRNSENTIIAGLEVQKYLSRTLKEVDSYLLTNFRKELQRLGYFLNDSMINEKWGDNCMLLDTYKDADCPDPERLPNWFKENPIVLIDRDRVYTTNSQYIKQLSDGY